MGRKVMGRRLALGLRMQLKLEAGLDSEDEGAWVAIEIEGEELDWFELAITEMEGKGEEGVMEEFQDTSGHVLIATETADSRGTTELYDSGCTNHISPYRQKFENFVRIPPRVFRAANQQNFSAIGKGDLLIDVPDGDDYSRLRLRNVLFSSDVAYTLVSIGRLDEGGFIAHFGHGKCVLEGPDGNRVGEVVRGMQRVYKVEHEDGITNAAVEALTLGQLHRRLGHPSVQVARGLLKSKMVTGIRLKYTPDDVPFFCESCVYAKAILKAVSKLRGGERATVFGGEIHSDLWGKAPVASKGGKYYWITFIDDMSRFTILYFLRTKDEAFGAYLKYEAWVEKQMGRKILAFNTDRGGEYVNDEFTAHLQLKGTIRKLSIHDTHQHSGVAERRNRTIQERVRVLLHASGLPKYLWTEAARHAVWMLNRTSTKAVEGMTPYEAAFAKKPDLAGIREWGEKVYVRIEGGNKLGGRVRMGRWLGVDDESKGVRVYWHDTKMVTVEWNTYFDNSSVDCLEGEENVQDIEFTEARDNLLCTNKNTPIASVPQVPPIVHQPQNINNDAIDAPEPTEPSRRIRKPSQKVQDLLEGRGVWTNNSNLTLVPPGVQLSIEREANDESLVDLLVDIPAHVEGYVFAAVIASSEALEPRSLAEAKRQPEWSLWEEAIKEELAALKAAETWELVDAPGGANVVGSKWVFRIKKDAGGKAIRFKARLVAQGFSQVPSVDYFDTFAPVARLASIRAVLAFAAAENLETGQIDIKGAYLNGELTDGETIYMQQAPGYAKGKLICRLKKPLYGLKQSGRRWYQKLVEIMEKLLFVRCEVDQAVFY